MHPYLIENPIACKANPRGIKFFDAGEFFWNPHLFFMEALHY